MREVATIPHPKYRISVLSWQQKFIVKVEAQGMEQLYKISELDTDLDTLKKSLVENSDAFTAVFEKMGELQLKLKD